MEKAKGTHILICDLDPITRKYIGGRLAEMGLEVMYSDDGPKCREMARRMQPNVILVDHTLLIPGGISLIKRLKAEEQTKKIPILILVDRDKEDMAQTYLTDFDIEGYISKEAEQKVIEEKINKVLNKHQPI